jgi:hypothetical protein
LQHQWLSADSLFSRPLGQIVRNMQTTNVIVIAFALTTLVFGLLELARFYYRYDFKVRPQYSHDHLNNLKPNRQPEIRAVEAASISAQTTLGAKRGARAEKKKQRLARKQTAANFETCMDKIGIFTCDQTRIAAKEKKELLRGKSLRHMPRSKLGASTSAPRMAAWRSNASHQPVERLPYVLDSDGYGGGEQQHKYKITQADQHACVRLQNCVGNKALDGVYCAVWEERKCKTQQPPADGVVVRKLVLVWRHVEGTSFLVSDNVWKLTWRSRALPKEGQGQGESNTIRGTDAPHAQQALEKVWERHDGSNCVYKDQERAETTVLANSAAAPTPVTSAGADPSLPVRFLEEEIIRRPTHPSVNWWVGPSRCRNSYLMRLKASDGGQLITDDDGVGGDQVGWYCRESSGWARSPGGAGVGEGAGEGEEDEYRDFKMQVKDCPLWVMTDERGTLIADGASLVAVNYAVSRSLVDSSFAPVGQWFVLQRPQTRHRSGGLSGASSGVSVASLDLGTRTDDDDESPHGAVRCTLYCKSIGGANGSKSEDGYEGESEGKRAEQPQRIQLLWLNEGAQLHDEDGPGDGNRELLGSGRQALSALRQGMQWLVLLLLSPLLLVSRLWRWVNDSFVIRLMFQYLLCLLILVCLSSYFGYLVLWLVWLVLGAVIDGINHITTATSSVCFISFIATNARIFRIHDAQARTAVRTTIESVLVERALRSLAATSAAATVTAAVTATGQGGRQAADAQDEDGTAALPTVGEEEQGEEEGGDDGKEAEAAAEAGCTAANLPSREQLLIPAAAYELIDALAFVNSQNKADTGKVGRGAGVLRRMR